MELSELKKELAATQEKARGLKDQIFEAESEFVRVRFQEKRADGSKFNGEGWYNQKTGKFKDGTSISGEVVAVWQ